MCNASGRSGRRLPPGERRRRQLYIILLYYVVHILCVCDLSKRGLFGERKKNVRRRERERKQGDAINAAGLWVAAADKVS